MLLSARRAPRLVLFNHKGGVGKTTLTVNIASALVEAGKRVLLVDTDPQCNLSSFFLEESYLDHLLDESESRSGNTLWSALRPVSEGTGRFKKITALKVRDGMYVAAGDIRLSHFENSLADCWNLCLSRNRRGYYCTSALSELVDDLVQKTKAHFVFFDSGPNIGPLNRTVLLDCSHFVIPAACDLFSTRALKTLGFALSEWVTTWERIAEMAPDGTALLRGSPELLGYIPQGFRVYRGTMTSESFRALAKLNGRVIDSVWQPLQKYRGRSIHKRPTGLKLGEVKYFGDLATKGQKEGVSLWEVSGGSAASKNTARKTFAALAQRIITLTK